MKERARSGAVKDMEKEAAALISALQGTGVKILVLHGFREENGIILTTRMERAFRPIP